VTDSYPSTDPRAPGSTASEIAPGVYVGGWADSSGFRGARICVLDEPEAGLVADLHLAIHDASTHRPIRTNLEGVAAFVEAARERGEPVLIFCGHGVRRGPLAGAWYLHRSQGITLDEAYAKIQKVRPQAETARKWLREWKGLDEDLPVPGASTDEHVG
jgi:hypothetical protein